MLLFKWDIPFPSPVNPKFSFIDLFAGIGGFRIPMQEIGGKCVLASENNCHAQKAYELNFGEIPFGDIAKIDLNDVPKHNILCAGFPCQTFNFPRKLKGFEDTKGTLIYYVFKIIERREPDVILLENVKHLLYHNNGNTINTIMRLLEEFGYKLSKEVLNSSNFGVPQNRERLIIIGHKKKKFDFTKLITKPKPTLKNFLDNENNFEFLNDPYTILKEMKTQESGLIFAGYRNKTMHKIGVKPNKKHLSRSHKKQNRIYSTNGVHPTLSSHDTKGNFWIYHKNKVRKLTIQECYKIMGFPKEFKLIKNMPELYRQIGISVAIPMVKEIAVQINQQLITTVSKKN